MEETLFEEYKSKLNANIKTRLEHIRRFVFTGQASVMVGAGFSKNGKTTDKAGMKDWNELAKIFYKKLYCQEPTDSDLKFVSPIRLASMIEATFGKKVLDELIENTLSPSNLKPSYLHEALLSVPWHDVFTTNYDTLLENSSAASSYTLVENKESLLYSVSPRIIKLHGSFRHTHPYIITEEDYRTYPKLHPEMVNTVRQALVENLFCLIGFSGNDPNFLSWLGWLRDVMGNNQTPVYMIAYDKNIHISNISLLNQLNINVINLDGCLKNGETFCDIQEALDFLLTYLVDDKTETDSYSKKPKETKSSIFEASKILHDVWNKKNEKDFDVTLKKCSEELENIRKKYPDWIVVPHAYYADFDDTESIFPNMNLDFTGIKEETLVKFLYELDFRLDVSFTPKGASWYITALEDIKLYWDKQPPLYVDLMLSLEVSLLSIYRQKCDKKHFVSLCRELEDFYELMDERTQNKFYFEKCLASLCELNYINVRRMLEDWNIRRSDIKSSLWKASIIAEVNGRKDAAKYLIPILVDLRRRMLTANLQNRQILISAQRIVCRRIKLYDWERDHWGLLEYDEGINESLELERLFLNKLNNIKNKPTHEEIVGFNINNHTQSWHSGRSGFVDEYLYAKRLLLLYESIGMPMGLPNYSINKDTLLKVFEALISYSPQYVIANIIRSSNRFFIDAVIDKTVIIGIDENGCVKKIFSDFYKICNRAIAQKDQCAYQRVVFTIIPLLVKFCVTLDDTDIMKVLHLVKTEIIEKGKIDKFNDLLVTIYNSLSPQATGTIAPEMFRLPLCSKNDRIQSKILMPDLFGTDYLATDDIVEIIKKGLTEEIDDNDYRSNIRDWAYDRLIKLYHRHLNEKNKTMLDDAIFEWRRKAEYKGNAFYSFNLLPYNPLKDSKNPKDEIKMKVQEFKSENYRYNGSSVTISSFNEDLSLLSAFYSYIESEEAEVLAENICKFLSENKTDLLKDDSMTFLGGMRYFTEPMFNTINIMLIQLATIGIKKKTASSLQKIVEEYEGTRTKYNIPLMQAIVALNRITNEKGHDLLLQEIGGMLMASRSEVKEDAALALCQFHDNTDFSEIIKEIISYTKVSQGNQTYQYLDIICKLIYNGIISGNNFTDLKVMLERIIYSVSLNSINENEASEIRFEMYELIGILSVWDMETLKQSEPINRYIEGGKGLLMDERKGMYIGMWRMQNRINS